MPSRSSRDDPPFYGADASHGLHVLRNKWVQRRYMDSHARALSKGLSQAISVTRGCVPHRHTKSLRYLIDRSAQGSGLPLKDMNDASVERRMEQQLFMAYGPDGEFHSSTSWKKLIAY